jgi:hypothetical protein
MRIFSCSCRNIHWFILAGCLLLAQSPDHDPAKKQLMLDMYQAYKSKSFPNIPDITVEEYLAVKKEEKIVLVDAREQEVSMISGAITK